MIRANYAEQEGGCKAWQVRALGRQGLCAMQAARVALRVTGGFGAGMRIEPVLGTKRWTTGFADRGKTWSKAVETPLHGHPAHLLCLRDGTLVSVYYITRDGITGVEATRWKWPRL